MGTCSCDRCSQWQFAASPGTTFHVDAILSLHYICQYVHSHIYLFIFLNISKLYLNVYVSVIVSYIKHMKTTSSPKHGTNGPFWASQKGNVRTFPRSWVLRTHHRHHPHRPFRAMESCVRLVLSWPEFFTTLLER